MLTVRSFEDIVDELEGMDSPFNLTFLDFAVLAAYGHLEKDISPDEWDVLDGVLEDRMDLYFRAQQVEMYGMGTDNSRLAAVLKHDGSSRRVLDLITGIRHSSKGWLAPGSVDEYLRGREGWTMGAEADYIEPLIRRGIIEPKISGAREVGYSFAGRGIIDSDGRLAARLVIEADRLSDIDRNELAEFRAFNSIWKKRQGLAYI